MIKTRIAFGVFVALSILALPAFAEENKLPFYFPEGVVQESNNKARQYEEYLRYMHASWRDFQQNSSGAPIVSPDSVKVETDLVSTAKTGCRDKMVLVLDNYVRMPDGRVRVTLFGKQQFITEPQLKVVVDDLVTVVDQASQDNIDYYSGLYDHILTVRSQKLGMTKEELVKQLDNKVDGTDVTYRELNCVPLPFEKSDFVPKEVHLGFAPYNEGVLGYTWLNTGYVSYNPLARVLDYLVGRPRVMQHEMIHANSKLQHWPLTDGFDPELMAMIPDGLYPDSQMDLLFHGYMSELRRLSRIYFGFDFKEAKNRYVKFDSIGNIIIDENEFNQYCDQVKVIQAEWFSFLRDVVVPEFYSDPVWYMAFNEKMQNDNSIFWLMTALHYNPTILDGGKNTMVWLEANRETILKFAKEAYQKSGEDSEGGVAVHIPQFAVNKYQQMFSEEERELLEEYFRKHPEDLKNLSKMNVAEALKAVNSLLERGGVE